jgi:hypothetical protein
MKKFFLAVVTLLPTLLAAQSNGVTISEFAVGTGSVTFNISWDKPATSSTITWSDSVWVFVDYNKAGVMTRLPIDIASSATLTALNGGTVTIASSNDKGVWVIGNARTESSFSATVALPFVGSNISGACVYASNYPPVGNWNSDGSLLTLTGTPPYTFQLQGVSDTRTELAAGGTYSLPTGYTLQAFTDATGALGLVNCAPPTAPLVAEAIFCYGYTGTLKATAAGSATVAWYDAATGGTLLYTGEAYVLPPLYSNTATYYAEAVLTNDCRSASRTQAVYTALNCGESGDCPGYTGGNIGAANTVSACAAHYVGQIGAVGTLAACATHYPGRIGQ